MKRSQALRGRNLTRNSRIDGVPMRTGPWAANNRSGAACFQYPSDTGAYASENPEVQ